MFETCFVKTKPLCLKKAEEILCQKLVMASLTNKRYRLSFYWNACYWNPSYIRCTCIRLTVQLRLR